MIFFDSEPQVAVHSNLTIVENVPVTIQISGVFYYTLLSTFTVAIADCDWPASDTYPATIISISGVEYGLPTLNLAGTSLTGWTAAFDSINLSYSNGAWAINSVNFCAVSNTANISSQIFDWVAGGTIVSANASICVNTYSDNNTRIYEDFRLETRRLTSAFAAWDNAQDLNTFDDSLGLQCQCSRLIYPQTNFTTYNPLPGQPNYLASAGTRTYFTGFYHTGTSHANGILQFGDHNLTEVMITAQTFKLEISKNGVDWYNCNLAYGGGVLNPNDGCRIDSGVYNITANNRLRFTLGTLSNTDATTGPAPNFWGLYIRISWTNAISNAYLGSFEITDWV